MKAGTPPTVEQLIDIALEEDLGRGDVTTRLCVPPAAESEGRVIAKQNLVVCGLDIFEAVMKRVDHTTVLDIHVEEGAQIESGTLMAVAKGKTASLLMAERVALNFLQRICGTATMTRTFVDAVPNECCVRLVDTRKTTPGMRYLERAAVLVGGGNNHRVDLGGGILIKENHIRAAGSVTAAVTRCKQNGPHPLAVEVEVTNRKELQEALDANADIIMLDNMTNDEMAECVKLVNGKALLEASGGVNLKTVAAIAQTGVDIISVGAFTHSAPSADISFLIE
ncbi:MAG: carboxylating nicotinate-nucleotide diphosphorylase [Deltaproteobacteria bacterium]|nr:carboxylating nicotinate-nucleotide diphosphorylase [Deltaproteobacteria bacterium]MBN2673039.1 carboxylating nicotinate-nucleotide diphosphorylase [Deltaproteobacteria bacterium]